MLVSYVYTADLSCGLRVSEVGMVGLNRGIVSGRRRRSAA
jgi:hypothetical protein